MRPQAEGRRLGDVRQRVKASSTSGVPTCRASGYAHPTQPHHPSIVVAAPCAGQQGTCIQQPEDVFLQALVHKDVGRHKARPLQLTMVWCGRSNERPNGLSVVRVFDDCAVGAHCCVGTETVPLLCQQHSYILNVGTYLGASASEEPAIIINILIPIHIMVHIAVWEPGRCPSYCEAVTIATTAGDEHYLYLLYT